MAQNSKNKSVNTSEQRRLRVQRIIIVIISIILILSWTLSLIVK